MGLLSFQKLLDPCLVVKTSNILLGSRRRNGSGRAASTLLNIVACSAQYFVRTMAHDLLSGSPRAPG